MNTPKLVLLSLIPIALLAQACAPAESKNYYGRRENPDVRVDVKQEPKKDDTLADPQAPAPTIEKPRLKWTTLDGGRREFDFKPQTDILFVIDNSDSMKEEQDNLSRNINRFAQDLRKNRLIDYHIGVVSVWDRSERSIAKATHKLGELRQVKNAAGRTGKARFITKARSDDALLAPTLKIGVMPYAAGGPETEEIFSPLSEALKKTGRGDTNEGFFREEAQLVVVIVTDADDKTPNTEPEQMAEELIQFKGGNKNLVTVYGVFTKKNDPDAVKDWMLRIHPQYHPECFEKVTVNVPARGRVKATTRVETKNNGTCKGFGPERLEQFLQFANPNLPTSEVSKQRILSLNQADYGKDLAKIGSDIAIRAMEKTISLPYRPMADEKGNILVRVRYGLPEQLARGGGVKIAYGTKGWTYNASMNSIEIAGNAVTQLIENARFAVDMATYSLDNATAPAPTETPAAASEQSAPADVPTAP